MKDLFLELALAENEGLGTWYEYLVKIRVFQRMKKKKIKTILLLGLPEKYGLSLDILALGDKMRLTIVDPRAEKLRLFRELSQGLVSDIKMVKSKVLKFTPEEKFDLVTNTEVAQEFKGKDLEKLFNKFDQLTAKYALVFIPNKDSYAHPRISGLNSYSLGFIRRFIQKNTNFEILDSDFIDIPPWPAGLSFQSTVRGTNNKEVSFLTTLLNKLARYVIPFLVKIEKLYPLFFKKRQAHMIYFLLEK